jgi:hypothetical protein
MVASLTLRPWVQNGTAAKSNATTSAAITWVHHGILSSVIGSLHIALKKASSKALLVEEGVPSGVK